MNRRSLDLLLCLHALLRLHTLLLLRSLLLLLGGLPLALHGLGRTRLSGLRLLALLAVRALLLLLQFVLAAGTVGSSRIALASARRCLM